MSRPSSIVMDHFNRPRGAGRMEAPDATGQAGRRGAGPAIRICLRIVGGGVEHAMFEAAGCGFTIAAGSAATELAAGKTLAECRAIDAAQVSRALGGLPSPKRFSAVLAAEAIQNALDQYESSQ